MKKMNRWDGVLLGVILLLAIVSLLTYFLWPKKSADTVEISIDGNIWNTFSLDENREVSIQVNDNVTNILVIENGEAYMKDAACPDHLCMKQGKISHDGESIVCLPNKVVVVVTSEQASEFDSIAK